MHAQISFTQAALRPAPLAGALLLALALTVFGPQAAALAQAPAEDGESQPLLTVFLEEHADPAEMFPSTRAAERQRLLDDLRTFYTDRDLLPAWSEEGRLRPIAGQTVEAIRELGRRHGIDPAAYQLSPLARRIEEAGDEFLLPVDLLAIETELTARLLAFVDDLCCGRIDPQDIEDKWHLKQADYKLASAIEKLVGPDADGESIRSGLERLAPPHEPYRQLLDGLERYRAIVARGGWPMVPEHDTLEVGDPAPVELLRALVDRLVVEDFLSGDAATVIRSKLDEGPTASYNPLLARAVEEFQRRHGLEVDGKLGPNTIAELRKSAEHRVRQIKLNLARWRWVPRKLSGKYLRVDVAGYRLQGFEDGRKTLEMDVVVGKKSTPTPLFSDRMTYIEVSPYWNVPESIATNEILPKLVSDPQYLEREGFEVVPLGDAPPSANGDGGLDPAGYNRDYRIRQLPGGGNALGRIKFMFPNEFNVYLHDTPAQSAFDRARRDLSHGCVRVAEPLDLAEWALAGNSEWTRERVRAAFDSPRPQQIGLPEPIPVYMYYWTAFPGDDGVIQFRDDLYGHDEALARLLADQMPSGSR